MIWNLINKVMDGKFVHFFYNKFDLHGFACSYLVRNFFKERNLLNRIDLTAVQPHFDIECKKDSIVILCDVELTPSLLFSLNNKASEVFIIDPKTYCDETLRSVIDSIDSKKFNIFTNSKVSPIEVVWGFLQSDKKKPKYVIDLQNSYLLDSSFTKEFENNYLTLKTFDLNYDIWDQNLSEENYENFNYSELLRNKNFIESKNISIRNSFPILLKDKKCMVINTNLHLMDEVGAISCNYVDIVITFERRSNFYYYRAYCSKDSNINLLTIFSKLKCVGFDNKVSFITSKFILDK